MINIFVLKNIEFSKNLRHLGKIEDGSQKWKILAIAVDSGACASVISPEALPGYQDFICETEASRSGEEFVGASGETIPNDGVVKSPMITREQTARGMTFIAARVAKPLTSVMKMVKEGHAVVFDSGGSYI